MYLHALYEMASVMDPGRHWKWIREVVSHFRVRAKLVRRKRDRMVGSHDLLLLGQKLIAGAPAQRRSRMRASTY